MLIRVFQFLMIVNLLAISIPGFSEPRIYIKNKYYYISPSTVDGIRTELNKKSPLKEKSKIFHALTDWKVKWAFWWEESWRKCSMGNAQVSLQLTYTYPKLSNPYFNDQVFVQFMTYKKALKKHEEKHGQIGLEAAKEIEQTLKKLDSEKTCELLSKKANAIAKDIIRKYKQKDDAFDKKTNHGKTEGVSLN